MKVMVEQVDIVETLTPMSFASFRDRLDKASGFQSVQFRELEFLLGYKRPDMLKYQPAGTPGLRAARARGFASRRWSMPSTHSSSNSA